MATPLYNKNNNTGIWGPVKPSTSTGALGSFSPTAPSLLPFNSTNIPRVTPYTGKTTTTPTRFVAAPKNVASSTPTSMAPRNQVTPQVVNPQPAPGSAAEIAARTGFTYTQNPYDAEIQKEIDAIYGRYREDANQVIDQNQIYKDTLNKWQTEIDSINNIYNDMLVRSRAENAPTYARRLGSTASLAVNQGLVGSNVGESNIRQVEQANAEEQLAAEALINEKRNMAIANIMGEVRKSSEAELLAKKEAKAQGADKLVDYLKNVPAQRRAKASEVIASMIAQGVDINELTPEEIKSLTEGLKVGADDLKAIYSSKVAEASEAKAKKELELMKAYPAIVNEYQFAVKNGYKGSFSQYQNEDANRKARATNPRLTIGEQNALLVSKVSQLFTPGATIPNTDGIPFVDVNGYATAEGFKTVLRAAQQSGMSRQDFIKQFGYTVAPGLEAQYGITPAEIKLITGALPEQE